MNRRGLRRTSPDAAWLDVWENPRRVVSDRELNRFVYVATEKLKRWTDGRRGGVAWSGGKDSAVSTHLAASLGIYESMHVSGGPDFEFDSFKRYADRWMPDDCHVVQRQLSWDYLETHPRFLFPAQLKKLDRGFFARTMLLWQNEKWKYQRRVVRDRAWSFIVMGRRNADGNSCGRDGVNEGRGGYTVLNPLVDWPHEVVLAYLRDREIELPPAYFEPDGWRDGARAWTMTTLDKVARHQPDIVSEHWTKLERIMALGMAEVSDVPQVWKDATRPAERSSET